VTILLGLLLFVVGMVLFCASLECYDAVLEFFGFIGGLGMAILGVVMFLNGLLAALGDDGHDQKVTDDLKATYGDSLTITSVTGGHVHFDIVGVDGQHFSCEADTATSQDDHYRIVINGLPAECAKAVTGAH
jgi:membrane-bound ClpP family serine protease